MAMSTPGLAVIPPQKPPLNALAELARHAGPDYAANLRADAESSRGTRSASTERALLGDILRFSGWCADAGLTHMPASAETVARFIDSLSAAGKSAATIRRYCASVSSYHRSARAPNPLELKIAKDALRRMARERGETQRQAKGITDNLVVKMLSSAGRRRVDVRNRAMLAVAYCTLCRRSELVRLLVEDIQVDGDGFATVRIRSSKVDQTGKGTSVAIASDAMALVKSWLAAAHIQHGPLFRRMNRHGRVLGPLDPASVSRIFKKMARRARLSSEEVAAISGHSARVGAAQDMIRYGADIAGAMQAGRWKTTTMVARYTENLDLKRGAVALVAQRREKFV
jgi:site-specific recombinase XerD